MLEVRGMKELLEKLNELSEAPEKAGKRALQKAGEHVKDVEVEVAKSEHNEYSQNVGWKELKKYGVKTKKSGSQVIDIGLRGKRTASQKKKDQSNKSAGVSRPTHWDRIKGLWYNNWGFYHNRTGKYVAGTNWIGKAYEKSSDKAYEIIRAEIIKEMGL